MARVGRRFPVFTKQPKVTPPAQPLAPSGIGSVEMFGALVVVSQGLPQDINRAPMFVASTW
jgi:hypothetical protein